MSPLRETVVSVICLTCAFFFADVQLVASAAGWQESSVVSAAEVSHESPVDQSPEALGDLLMVRGNYAAAITAYQHAVPPTAVTWNKLGIAYHHLFALDEAMKDYKLAIALDPHYAGAYNNLGAVYHGKHQFSLAEKAYKRAIKYQPRSAVTYCNLGTAYFAESKYKKGIKAYQEALKIDPEVFNPEQRAKIEEGSSREERMAIAFYLAEVYASSGRKNEALVSLRKALSNGFNDRKRLMEDKELASLRQTPEFQELMDEEQLR
jgi:tetratricopeptide (TPR) repeat protein